MESILQSVDAKLGELLPSEYTSPQLLHAAMRYSVFSGGKRIRPVLCVAMCEALGGRQEDALLPACAIELLHKYTLIHDDLPAMDNDALRNGKPTCHVQFNEATAILAGDALLTLSFEILGKSGNAQLVVDLAQAAGSLGTMGGQQDDMTMKDAAPTKEELLEMQRRKTTNLIAISCVMGARCANASDSSIDHARLFGEALGKAFQLLDDLCDNDPVTMKVIGREETMRLAEQYKAESYKELSFLGKNTKQLHDIVDYTYASFTL
ncbi:MAG: polyprenyl synthetase family protein [Candidatus Andersenbacteria bacterium]|nr:polyprenyl synthetase family protein [Candidatus Andersenbacteria bacterium]